MINLRTRLLVGYGYMVVLLLLTTSTAIFGFVTINEAIDRILSEKLQSVSASVQMMESLELQEELTMRALLGEGIDDDELAAADEVFDQALATARQNVTIAGEEILLDEVEERLLVYRALRERVFERHGELLSPRSFARDLFPAFVAIRESVFALIEINHRAMAEADEEAQASALHLAGLLGVIVTIALISMIILSRALQQKVLFRLRNLTRVAEAILTGDTHRRFDTSINDELGVLSAQLNAALDTRDELQAQMRGRLNQQKQLALGLLDEVEGGLLLIGLDGKLIASTWEEFDPELIALIQSWLVENRKPILHDFREEGTRVEVITEFDQWRFHIRLLAAGGKRPVGWMIRCEDCGGDDDKKVCDGNEKTVE